MLWSSQSIRRMIDKKTVDVYAMFIDELNIIKKELTLKLVALPASHPKYAGQAHWARLLKRGIERSMTVGLFSCFLLDECLAMLELMLGG